MIRAKKIFIGILASLALVLAGCGKKITEKNSVDEVLKEEDSTEEIEPIEESQTRVQKDEEEKKYLDSVLLEENDIESWIERQSEFADFSTKLPIGDKVLLSQDLPVWKNRSCLFDKDIWIKENSLVYPLQTAPSRAEISKEMIEFCDDNGNHGWIGAHFLQKQYTTDDSIIKKQWVQDEYDFACFSPDGKTVAFQRFDNLHSDEKGVLIADRETGAEIFSAPNTPKSRICYAFSPDSKYFYFSSGADSLCQIDTESGEALYLNSVFDTAILGIYPLDDAENVLLALYSGWAMFNKKERSMKRVPSKDFMWANSFAFSPDGKFIAGSATNPNGIALWDLDRNLIWEKYDDDYCGKLHFSDDARILNVVNSKGITSIDAGNGEEIDKTRINFPYHLALADYEVNVEKNRVVFALNERDFENNGSYIYVYDLAGKFVQAERINDEGKKIEDIALSPDGEYISIRIQDGSNVNECHQVICKIDLDKEPCELPKNEKNVDELAEEKAFNFLLDTSFELGGYSLNFFYDGTYTLSARHDGTMTGVYELYTEKEHGRFFVKFSGCGYGDNEDEFESRHKDLFGGEWVTSFPETYLLQPDYIDFNVIGAFTYTDDCEIAIPSCKQSPSGYEYDYLFASTGKFEKVYKFPTWQEKGQCFLYVNENTKMRKEPFLSAEPVYMPYNDSYKGECIESRCVLYAGTTHKIVGKTMREDTIDGVTAPWYLVWEDSGLEDSYDARLVWVFGGFSEVLDADK